MLELIKIILVYKIYIYNIYKNMAVIVIHIQIYIKIIIISKLIFPFMELACNFYYRWIFKSPVC